MNRLITKVNGKNGKRLGYIVAVNNNNQIHFGFSLCRKTDKFDKTYGFETALERAEKGSTLFPRSLKKSFDHFYKRAIKYFKGSNIPPIEIIEFKNETL